MDNWVIRAVRELVVLLVLASGLLFSDLFTVVRADACPDEQLPELIGLPLPYRTSVPWVNSMSGVIFLAGLLVDLLFWALVVGTLRFGAQRFVRKYPRWATTLKIGTAILVLLSGTLVFLILIGIEWHLQWLPRFPMRCPVWSITSRPFVL